MEAGPAQCGDPGRRIVSGAAVEDGRGVGCFELLVRCQIRCPGLTVADGSSTGAEREVASPGIGAGPDRPGCEIRERAGSKQPFEIRGLTWMEVSPRGGGQGDDEHAVGRWVIPARRGGIGDHRVRGERDDGESRERDGPSARPHEASIMPFSRAIDAAIRARQGFRRSRVVSLSGAVPIGSTVR